MIVQERIDELEGFERQAEVRFLAQPAGCVNSVPLRWVGCEP